MSEHEKQKQELLKKVMQLPNWQQRIFFAKARAMGLVTITEKDISKKPKLYLVRG